ncbi:MAG: CHAT domain-containing tetratricopeptide repeat protein [Acidobacteriota bacterium]|nr:CHAT domain-containing tetratricopeptide repeat protein [Acidobacteriota bacterium]
MFNLKNLSSVFSVNFSRAFLRAAAMLALFAIATSAIWLAKASAQNASSGQAQPAQEIPTLELGKPIERELAGGQSHSYQLKIPAGQYVKLLVNQRGIDIKLRFSGQDNKQLIEWDRQPGGNGEENLEWAVESEGVYRLIIIPTSQTARVGSYELIWKELRAAETREQKLTKAYLLWQESLSLTTGGKYEAAIPKAIEAVQILEALLGTEHEDVARPTNLLANLHYVKGNYTEAESFFKRALLIREKALGTEHPDTATSYNNLAVLYAEKGDHISAEFLYQRAMAIREKALGAEHPDFAASLNNLANLYRARGNYLGAEPLFRQAQAIWEKTLGPEHPRIADSCNNLGNLYRSKNDFASAEPLYKRALAIREKAFGEKHPTVASSLHNLANLYRDKGDYLEAEKLYNRVRDIWEKTLGTEHPDVATLLNNLSMLYVRTHNYAAAELLLKRSLAIYEKALGAEHPDVADCLHNLGNIYATNGDYSSAEQLHLRALAIREKTLGAEHPRLAESLHDFAALSLADDKTSLATSLLERLLTINDTNLRRNLSGSDRQQQVYLKSFERGVNSVLALHAQYAPDNSQALQLALTALLRFKGRGLDESSDSLNRLRARADKETLPMLDQLFSMRSQYATLVLRGPDERTLKTYRTRLEQLGQGIETLEADLSRRSLEFRTTTLPITPEAVTAAIPVNAALVEFVQYRPVEAKTDKRLAPRYVAYVLTTQNEPRWVDLGDATAIDGAVEQLRQALRDPKRRDYQQLSRVVDKQVMEPVRKLIGGKAQLLLSPDGMLNLLPFAVLVDDGGKFLLERYKLTYLSSGRDLLRLQIKQDAGTEVFVMAAPDFEQSAASSAVLAANATDAKRDIVKLYGSSGIKLSESVSMGQVYFRPLPWTAKEAASLKTLMPDAKVMTDGAATEMALKQLRRPRLLHVATHGYFLKDLVMTEATRNERPATELPQKIAESEKIENPLLRSGLALAGANKRKSGDDDGILTALEAAGLDLWGTKLVALSACDTGVGEVKNGDGVYGLRRAFVLAGSETQVMSLWAVSDMGTKELMVEYYKRLMKGEGRGDALRQVQLRMLKNPKRSHPFYWASFIQSGEWANLDGKR